jgi:hypothetical protein
MEQRGHLTNEQLSAYLDRQITPQEQAFFDAHLASCLQCRAALAELRATVSLLRAMPRPEVPRSFALPASVSTAANITPFPGATAQQSRQPGQSANGRTGGPLHEPQAAQNARIVRPAFRRTVRVVSTLVAVLGLLFVLSGLLTNVHLGGATNSAASMTSGSSSSAEIPAQTPQASSLARTPTTFGTHKPQKLGETGATPPAQKTPEIRPVQPGTTTTPANQSALPPFFDLSTMQGRLTLGLALVVLGIFGWFITRRRYRQARN